MSKIKVILMKTKILIKTYYYFLTNIFLAYILRKPVKIKYSLDYRVDSRPKIMDSARVSFKAIRTSNEVNDELFDPLGQQMLSEIRKGKRTK